MHAAETIHLREKQTMPHDHAVSSDCTRTVTEPAAFMPAETRLELFGSFLLGDNELALPAHCIREVVNLPEKLTTLPLSPPFLAGIFTLRGSVIPVLDLRNMFGMAELAGNGAPRVAIIDHEQVQIGILFDDIGEVLRVKAEQRCCLEYREADAKGVIAGTIRLSDGARLVQILNPAALIHIDNLPRIVSSKSARRDESSNLFRLQTERHQCVSFQVSGIAFALEMRAIQEIIKVPELKNSVMQSPLCKGRIDLRGSAIAVVDFASLLKLERADGPPSSDARIIVARIGKAAIGLPVDSVDSILNFFLSDVLPIPLLSKDRSALFSGCLHQKDAKDLLLLNHEAIFSQAEIGELTAGHDRLYLQQNPTGEARRTGTGKAAQRRSYITFSLAHPFAIDIAQVREIIDCSLAMIRPPNLPPFVHGVLNLRRQMITVINLRRWYGMQDLDDTSQARILVIELGSERYGLLVDAIQGIVSASGSQRRPAPKLMRHSGADPIGNEMQEVIDIDNGENERQTFCVFDAETFDKRLMYEIEPAGNSAALSA